MIDLQTEEVIFTAEPRRYIIGGRAYRSVTEQINDVGFGPDFSRANPDDVKRGQRRGTMVDTALVYHYEDDLDESSLHPSIRGYFNGALKFDRECPGKIVAIHPKLGNASLGVAGTPDLIRFIRGHRAVLDWKTGVDNPLQTWMYMMLWNLKYPKRPCYERYGLKLNADGTYRLKEHNDPDDGAAAMAILTGDHKAIELWRPKYGHLNA